MIAGSRPRPRDADEVDNAPHALFRLAGCGPQEPVCLMGASPPIRAYSLWVTRDTRVGSGAGKARLRLAERTGTPHPKAANGGVPASHSAGQGSRVLDVVFGVRGGLFDLGGGSLAFLLDVLGGVGGGGLDVFHGFLGRFLQALGHVLGGFGQLGGHRFGGGLEGVGGLAFLLARRDQRGDQQPGAERDQAGGERVALGFGGGLVRGIADGLAGVLRVLPTASVAWCTPRCWIRRGVVEVPEVLWVACSAVPMTLSFTPKTASLTLSVWRWTMLEGVTLSATASTLVPRRARVASMSARMASGFSLIGGLRSV